MDIDDQDTAQWIEQSCIIPFLAAVIIITINETDDDFFVHFRFRFSSVLCGACLFFGWGKKKSICATIPSSKWNSTPSFIDLCSTSARPCRVIIDLPVCLENWKIKKLRCSNC